MRKSIRCEIAEDAENSATKLYWGPLQTGTQSLAVVSGQVVDWWSAQDFELVAAQLASGTIMVTWT